MSNTHILLSILVIAAVTALVRFAPFWLFPPGRPTPRYILYLGRVLPRAVIGMLVIYCFKHVNFGGLGGFLPDVLAGALTAGRCYREAAVLYRERLRRPLDAARCLEQGGLWGRGAPLAHPCRPIWQWLLRVHGRGLLPLRPGYRQEQPRPCFLLLPLPAELLHCSAFLVWVCPWGYRSRRSGVRLWAHHRGVCQTNLSDAPRRKQNCRMPQGPKTSGACSLQPGPGC